jgi:hypothetical protein
VLIAWLPMQYTQAADHHPWLTTWCIEAQSLLKLTLVQCPPWVKQVLMQCNYIRHLVSFNQHL